MSMTIIILLLCDGLPSWPFHHRDPPTVHHLRHGIPAAFCYLHTSNVLNNIGSCLQSASQTHPGFKKFLPQ